MVSLAFEIGFDHYRFNLPLDIVRFPDQYRKDVRNGFDAAKIQNVSKKKADIFEKKLLSIRDRGLIRGLIVSETNFSFHAFGRILGRISMSYIELADLLDANLFLNIGQEANSNRVHKLFYSAKDNICFVAIQDIKTGTVVTVLPIDYHENISWAISIEAQNQAKKLITKDKVYSPNVEILNTNATVFRISGNVVNEYGKYQKTVNLGSWPCLPYEHSIDALVEDKKFVGFLTDKIKKIISAMCTSLSYVQTISIRLGNKGEPVFFTTSEIIDSATMH